jgi:hypothetical protein
VAGSHSKSTDQPKIPFPGGYDDLVGWRAKVGGYFFVDAEKTTVKIQTWPFLSGFKLSVTAGY